MREQSDPVMVRLLPASFFWLGEPWFNLLVTVDSKSMPAVWRPCAMRGPAVDGTVEPFSSSCREPSLWATHHVCPTPVGVRASAACRAYS